jgi:arginyl-tRNA synthetase
VLARAAEAGFATDDATLAAADLESLGSPGEATVIRKLAEWPRQLETAAASHEPHRIAFYLNDLASDFHALQHQGKLEPELRFIREDAPETTRARLALVRATQLVVATGLGILGVTPMDEMR